MNNSSLKPYVYLTILCLFAYLIGNWTLSLVDPDEVFYSLTAKEMLDNGSFFTPYIFGQPQFEKPPLCYWLLMLSFKLFGVTPFAARLSGVLFALFGVLGTFYFLKRVVSEQTAFLSSLVLATSIWWVAMSKVVLTDLHFTVFITFAFYSFYLWFKERKQSSLWYFALWSGLAVLTKGPLGIAFPLLGCGLFLLLNKQKELLKDFLLHPWWILFAALAAPWYAYMFAVHGNAFWEEFFVRDHWMRFLMAEHKNFDRWYFYPAVLFISVLPWLCGFPYLGKRWKENRELLLFIACWCAVVYVVCHFAHSKLASYISPLYCGYVIAVGISLESAISERSVWRERTCGALALLFGIAAVAAPFAVKHRFPDLLYPVLFSIIPLAIFFCAAAFCAFFGRMKGSFVALSAALPVFLLAGAILVPPHLERGLTDSDLPSIISEQDYNGDTIVAGKIYARGVRFYSGKNVVVLSGSAQPYWSPHPLLIINEDQEIRDFYKTREQVLSILSEKDTKRMRELLGDAFEHQTLSSKIGRVVSLSKRR